MPTYTNIGMFVAVHGVRGELILKHSLGKKTSLKNVKALFIEEKKNSFLPWFIESSKARNSSEMLVKLEGLDSREAALPLIRKVAWIPDKEAEKLMAKSSRLSLLGYTLVEKKEVLGPLLELIEQPHQLIGRLEIRGHEVLIPLNAETILRIDHPKKQVMVSLPEGLLDVYLPQNEGGE